MKLESYQGMWGHKNEQGEEIWFTPLNQKLLSGRTMPRIKFTANPLHYWAIRDIQSLSTERAAPRIIDFGCGTGSETIHLSRCVNQPIVGYDIFPTQIAIANEFEKSAKLGCSFHAIDNLKIPEADGSVDIIYSSHVLGHIADVSALLREWARILKPGGRVILYTESDFSPEDQSLAADIYRKFGVAQLRQLEHHISLHPKEELERLFRETGLRVQKRVAYTAWKPVFDPDALVDLLQQTPKNYAPLKRVFLKVWAKVRKLLPFYPLSTNAAYTAMGNLFGANASSDCYFYHLEKVAP